MRQWILLAVILSAGLATAHTVTMDYAVRVGNSTANNTLRVNDTIYNGTMTNYTVFPQLTKSYISINKTNTLTAIVSPYTVTATINNSYYKDIGGSGLVVRVHMDGNTNDSADGNNGDKQNGVDCTVTGNIFGGCSFDGSNDYINFTTFSALDGQKNYTIAVWIKTSSDGGIFSQSDGTGSHMLAMAVSSGLPSFLTFQSSAGNVVGNTVVSDGTWHHVTITKSGTIGSVYVDGLLEKTGAVASPTTTNESKLGAREGNTFPFLGTLDEFFVYNRSLNAAQIYDLYRFNPKYFLTRMTQRDSGRFLIAVTNGTYTDIENKLDMAAATGMVSSTFGNFLISVPAMSTIFMRLEYSDIDISNRLEWSGTGRLLIRNLGLNSKGIPNIALELTR